MFLDANIVKNQEAIATQKKLMTLTGLWPKREPSLKYRTWGNTNLLFILVFVIFQIHGVIFRSDFFIVVDNCLWSLQGAAYGGKFFIFTLQKQKVLSLIEFMEDPVFNTTKIELNIIKRKQLYFTSISRTCLLNK